MFASGGRRSQGRIPRMFASGERSQGRIPRMLASGWLIGRCFFFFQAGFYGLGARGREGLTLEIEVIVTSISRM